MSRANCSAREALWKATMNESPYMRAAGNWVRRGTAGARKELWKATMDESPWMGVVGNWVSGGTSGCPGQSAARVKCCGTRR